ncbi:hypothetical protein [Streptomyces sp. TLI_185]|uniref:hypothetical protein n=1 Tax=Streptomyces sp. TLI_185 TaxID=2485151 RepID=UPI000FB3F373|nr:hypothetical protein [Streptomyces sp. TLI_185]RPF33679.1 MinD-like ATPase involved in chromosome partitioning or flagellar assembly [Streptomyces sp. TLI_185]
MAHGEQEQERKWQSDFDDWQHDVLQQLGEAEQQRASAPSGEAVVAADPDPAPPGTGGESTLRLVHSARDEQPAPGAGQFGPSAGPMPAATAPAPQHIEQATASARPVDEPAPPQSPVSAMPASPAVGPLPPLAPPGIAPAPAAVIPVPPAVSPTPPLAPPTTAPEPTTAIPAHPTAPESGPPAPAPPIAAPAPASGPHSQVPVPAPTSPSAPATPTSTPESLPTLDPRLALALGRPHHGDSLAHRTGRTLRRLTTSVSQDVAEQTRIARELQQPVTTGRVIAVTSIRGGVGKSTVAALLGRTFNHYRHDPVLTLEADAALGTLPVRMGAESVRWSCADLARILTPAMQLTHVTGYLVPVADGGWLLPGSQGKVGAPLDVRTYRTVTLALRRYFSVTVVDCETLPGDVARTAMDTAHARVVVAPMTAEGVGGTRQVLDWLGQLPHSALATTVVALTASSPDMILDVKAATAHLKETGVPVVVLPYDRHLAGGGPIRTDLLGRAAQDSAMQLAAEALHRAVRAQ